MALNLSYRKAQAVIHKLPRVYNRDPLAHPSWTLFAQNFTVDHATRNATAMLAGFPELRRQYELLVPSTVCPLEFWRRYYFALGDLLPDASSEPTTPERAVGLGAVLLAERQQEQAMAAAPEWDEVGQCSPRGLERQEKRAIPMYVNMRKGTTKRSPPSSRARGSVAKCGSAKSRCPVLELAMRRWQHSSTLRATLRWKANASCSQLCTVEVCGRFRCS